MAIETHDPLERQDNRVALWTVVALVALAVLAYGAYASYHPRNSAAYTTGSTVDRTNTNVTTDTNDRTANSTTAPNTTTTQ
jgi:hypothetical protein